MTDEGCYDASIGIILRPTIDHLFNSSENKLYLPCYPYSYGDMGPLGNNHFTDTVMILVNTGVNGAEGELISEPTGVLTIVKTNNQKLSNGWLEFAVQTNVFGGGQEASISFSPNKNAGEKLKEKDVWDYWNDTPPIEVKINGHHGEKGFWPPMFWRDDPIEYKPLNQVCWNNYGPKVEDIVIKDKKWIECIKRSAKNWYLDPAFLAAIIYREIADLDRRQLFIWPSLRAKWEGQYSSIYGLYYQSSLGAGQLQETYAKDLLWERIGFYRKDRGNWEDPSTYRPGKNGPWGKNTGQNCFLNDGLYKPVCQQMITGKSPWLSVDNIGLGAIHTNGDVKNILTGRLLASLDVDSTETGEIILIGGIGTGWGNTATIVYPPSFWGSNPFQLYYITTL